MGKLKDFCKSFLCLFTGNRLARFYISAMFRKGVLPEWLMLRLPIKGTFPVKMSDGNSFKYSAIAQDAIGRRLFWGGIEFYDSETLEVFYRLAQRSSLILDIGANTGIFTLVAAAANPLARIVAFEPVPQVFERLLINIKINGWEDRCRARQEAVSNSSGYAQLNVPVGYWPVIGTLLPPGTWTSRATYQIKVAVTILDKLFSEGQRVDLIKLDVEGLEDKVLEGMQRILAESAPAIIVEVHPEGPYQDIERILAGFGYSFIHLRPEGPVPVKKIIPDPGRRYLNYLCIVQNNIEEILELWKTLSVL